MHFVLDLWDFPDNIFNNEKKRKKMVQDQVFYLHDGWYAFVEGKLFGPWELKPYAIAGMQTEQRRAATRKEKDNGEKSV